MKSKSKKGLAGKGGGRAAALYKIETGVKVSAVTQGTSSVAVGAVAATMAALEKGQSFLIKNELSALKAAPMYRGFQQRERARGGGREFTSRKVGTGLRIWRVT